MSPTDHTKPDYALIINRKNQSQLFMSSSDVLKLGQTLFIISLKFMRQVNIHEAKTHFSRLLKEVEAGEEIVIARNGKPVARLVPYNRELKPRTLGGARGKIWMAEDFNLKFLRTTVEFVCRFRRLA